MVSYFVFPARQFLFFYRGIWLNGGTAEGGEEAVVGGALGGGEEEVH